MYPKVNSYYIIHELDEEIGISSTQSLGDNDAQYQFRYSPQTHKEDTKRSITCINLDHVFQIFKSTYLVVESLIFFRY